MSSHTPTAAPTREIVFWTCDDDGEYLTHSDRNDAIEELLDANLAPGMTAAQVLEELPETIDVYGYARMKVETRATVPEDLVRAVLDDLDETYSGPDGSLTEEPTAAMLDAARALIAAVVAEYKPWACERVTTEHVDVNAWIREHRPDWLTDEEAARVR